MFPIKGDCYITQTYGLTDYAKSSKAYRNFPGGIHPGMDFGTHGKNLPVVSVCRGKVVRAGMDGGWGNHIEVRGEDGWNRQYCHLHRIFVRFGDEVEAGHELGQVGTTGASTGVHLHYGNRRQDGSLLKHWTYREPSGDFRDAPKPDPFIITKKYLKGTMTPEIFAYAQGKRFHVPDYPTFVFLTDGEMDKVETVPEDVISKIPKGPSLTSVLS